jgi:hypothetical protein
MRRASAAESRLRRHALVVGALILLAIGLERLVNAYLLQGVIDVHVRLLVGFSCTVAGAFLLGRAVVIRKI